MNKIKCVEEDISCLVGIEYDQIVKKITVLLIFFFATFYDNDVKSLNCLILRSLFSNSI